MMPFMDEMQQNFNDMIPLDKQEEIKKFMPKDKVGIRVLDELQMENVFPAYNSLLNRIEMHRDNIKNIPRLGESEDYQFNMMYDNVYSILGKRGSGKTSSLMTIKMILQSKTNYDRVLPIIIPDVIPERESIMGWLLAVLEEQVKMIEKQLGEKKSSELSSPFFEDCKIELDKELRNIYEEVKEMSHSQSFNTEMMHSYYDVLSVSELKAKNSYTFSKRFSQFWDTMIESIRKLYPQTTPLIYIMFDDVDLSPQRVDELLSTIIKYLSHPNVIVITTADEELFLKVVEHNFERKLNAPIRHSMYYSVREAVEDSLYWRVNRNKYDNNLEDKTARLYLEKVLPSSTRYFLNTFVKWEDIAGFRLDIEGENGKILKEAMGDLIDSFYKQIGVQEKNFLFWNEEFLNVYLSFFGKTSRQITNQWIIIKQFVCEAGAAKERQLKENGNFEMFKRRLYHMIRNVLHNMINANQELKNDIDNIEGFIDEIFSWEYNSYSFYIDYNFISRALKKKSENKKGEVLSGEIKNATALMMLCAFIENILLVIDKEGEKVSPKRRTLHLLETLVSFYKWITKGEYQLIQSEETVELTLYMYEKFFEKPEVLLKFDLYNFESVSMVLMNLDIKDISKNLFDKFEENGVENSLYYKTYAKMLFLLYNDIYCINTAFLNRIEFSEKIFEVPCMSKWILKNQMFQEIEKLLFDNINKNMNGLFVVNQGVVELYNKFEIKEELYTLGEVLMNASEFTDGEEILNLSHTQGLEALKEMIGNMEFYIIFDEEKYGRSLSRINHMLDRSDLTYSLELKGIIGEMMELGTLEEEVGVSVKKPKRIVQKELITRFYKEFKDCDKMSGGRLSDSKIWDELSGLFRNMDLVELDLSNSEMKDCANLICVLKKKQSSYFVEMLEKYKTESIYSSFQYLNDVLNKNDSTSQKWFQELVQFWKKNSELKDEVLRELKGYVAKKMDDMEKL